MYNNLNITADNEGSIPSQFPVQEDTVFAQILKESLDFFSIPEKLHKEHFLVDFKTRKCFTRMKRYNIKTTT